MKLPTLLFLIHIQVFQSSKLFPAFHPYILLPVIISNINLLCECSLLILLVNSRLSHGLYIYKKTKMGSSIGFSENCIYVQTVYAM